MKLVGVGAGRRASAMEVSASVKGHEVTLMFPGIHQPAAGRIQTSSQLKPPTPNGNFNLWATDKATAFPNESYNRIIVLTFDISIILGGFLQLPTL